MDTQHLRRVLEIIGTGAGVDVNSRSERPEGVEYDLMYGPSHSYAMPIVIICSHLVR